MSDKKFAIVYTDFSFSTENEDMIEHYKSQPNFLAVLPYDFYLNLEKDEMTVKHNERMYDKVTGWIDGYRTSTYELLEALETIAEYWNRDRNDTAMHDACWYAINTAKAAIAKARGED